MSLLFRETSISIRLEEVSLEGVVICPVFFVSLTRMDEYESIAVFQVEFLVAALISACEPLVEAEVLDEGCHPCVAFRLEVVGSVIDYLLANIIQTAVAIALDGFENIVS